MNNLPIRLGLIMSFLSLFLYGNAQLAPRLELTNPGEVLILTNSRDCTAYVDLTATGIGFCDGLEITNDSPYGTADNDASADYPTGEYTVVFTATDDCNNEITQEVSFAVKDGKAPTAICLYGLVAMLSPTCELRFDATYLEASSHDNCTNASDLKFEIARIDRDGNFIDRGASILFGCADVGVQAVVLFVIDAAGNEAYCTTAIDLQRGICDMTSCDQTQCIETVITVGHPDGGIGPGIGDLEVFVNGENMGFFGNPIWFCVDTDLASNQMIIEVFKEGDILNGVNILDLVYLTRYLKGQSNLNHYSRIAVDVNNDQRVTNLDLIEIKLAILGRISSFSGNVPLWRFIDGKHVFRSSTWASEIPFYITVNNPMPGDLSNYEHHLNAVKLGDSNGDADANIRSSGCLNVNVDNMNLIIGEEISVSLQAELSDIQGYQFTLNFDPAVLEFIEIKGALKDNDYNYDRVEEGVITVVHMVKEELDDMFQVKFEVLSNSKLQDALKISSGVTKPLAIGSSNELLDVKLNYISSEKENKLYQNSPNPFTESTTIGFSMESAGLATIKVMDIAGKVVFENTNPAKQGYNEIELTKSDLGTTGVYYCHLTTGNSESTVKMILF